MSINYYRRAIELSKIHQLRSRQRAGIYKFELSPEQIHVLLEIALNPSGSIKQLIRIINLDRNTISRAIKKLQQTDYINSSSNTKDLRTSTYAFTDKAYDTINKIDQANRRFVETHLVNLNDQEIAQFQIYQSLIGSCQNIPSVRLRPTEHPFQAAIRLGSRALGFIGNNLFSSGYDSTTWQILWLIKETESCTLSKLQQTVQIPISTLSQIVRKLELDKFILKENLSKDRRLKLVLLTSKGEKALEHINSCGENIFIKAFADAPPQSIAHYTVLLAKYLGLATNQKLDYLRPALSISEVTDLQELDLLRSFAAYQLVCLNWHTMIAPTFYSSLNTIYVLKADNSPVAACEIIKRNHQIEIHHFTYKLQVLSESEQAAFINQVVLRISTSKVRKQILIHTKTIPNACYNTLKIEKIDEQWSSICANFEDVS